MPNKKLPSLEKTAELIFYLSAVGSILAFVFCYLFIGYFNRWSTDDHSYIYSVNHYGFWGSVYDWYFRNGGDFAASMMLHGIFFVFQNLKSLLPIYVLTLVLLLPAFYFFVRAVVVYYFNIYQPTFFFRFRIFLLSALLLSAFYCLSPDVTQIWFWTSASAIYLYSLGFLMFAIALIPGNKGKLALCISAGIFFLFAGTRINYMVMAAAVYSLFLARQMFILKKQVDRKHYFIFAMLVAGGILYIAAPGNYTRRALQISTMPHYDSYPMQLVTVVPKILSELVIDRGIYLLIWFLPAFVIGCSFSKLLPPNSGQRIKPVKTALTGLAIFLLLLIINITMLYITVKSADYPRRVYTLVFLFFFGYIMSLLFILGLKTGKIITLTYVAAAIAMAATIFWYGKIVWKQYPYLKTFSRAIDMRFAETNAAQRQNFNRPVLYLAPLPPRGILPINDIDTDTATYINSDMRKRFGWKFAIALTDSTKRPQYAITGINEFTPYLHF